MEDSMFRRLEHKTAKKEDDASDGQSVVGTKPAETRITFFDEPEETPIPEPVIEPVQEVVVDEPPRKPENRLSFSDEPGPVVQEPVTHPEPVPDEPHKKTAVEVIFGPNNRKKRKEEAQKAIAEGRTPELPPKKSAVEIVFGPNNRKKRKEEAERALAEGRVIEQPPKKTAVEIIFGPNNRKKRKEEEQRALAEGRVIERPPKKSAVEIVFGPNNRKKRKEEAARLESERRRMEEEDASRSGSEDGEDGRRLEI